LWIQNICSVVEDKSPMLPILIHINSTHIFPTYKNKYILILSYHLYLGLGCVIFSFTYPNFLHSRVCYLSPQSCPPVCVLTYLPPPPRISRPPHLQTRHVVITGDMPEVCISLSPTVLCK
jgi:hypothetical protein